MLKAIRKHLKSKKSTQFMQYMKISRKEEFDNNWIDFRTLDDLTNDLVEHNVYHKKDFIDLINSNNINDYNWNQNYYNYNRVQNNKREDKKRIELQLCEDTKIRDLEAIQLNRQHLHALHRFRRHKKRGMSSEKDVVISFSPKTRVSIVNKPDFYCRFGQQEEEAMACFDFLNDISCDNTSDYTDANDTNECTDRHSIDGRYIEQCFRSPSSVSVGSNCGSNECEDWSLGRNNSQLSLSDSCVEYYSESYSSD